MAKQYASNRDETVRMFQSDVLELFTRVHPAVPHLLFLPVIAYMLYLGASRGLAVGEVALWGVAGILGWTLTEYVVHRFLFHVSAETQDKVHAAVRSRGPGEAILPKLDGLKEKYYFIAHGVHHDFPSDSRRLVMPPSLSIPLAFAFYFLFLPLLGTVATPPFFAGFVVGYLVYDTTHYAVHHFRPHTAIGRFLKKHHFRHHYNDSDRDFGVSSPLWDVVFRTYGRSETSKSA